MQQTSLALRGYLSVRLGCWRCRQAHRKPLTEERAKALVALWEALPATASHQGAFDFPDASRSLSKRSPA
jgi:hypothetical protein